MAPQPTCVQFKETRINFDWNAKGSIVDLEIPSAYSSHSTDLQPWSASKPSDDAESAFARDNLATASSIYFRPLNRYPRVILWRVTDNGRALSLHPVDFSRPSNARGGTVEQSIKIHFPAPIKDHSVGLADGGKAVDELVVYVLLTDKQIYTLRLKPEFWRSPAARKRVPDWCRSYLPSSFTLNNPHFLVAVDGRSCLVALQNGGLVRLVRGVNQVDVPDAPDTKYTEQSYNNSLLSTFRQMIPLASGGISPATIISVAQWADTAPINPKRYSLTVSMSHALKVWSPDHASSLWEGDLANDTNGASKHPLPATPRHLVSIIDVGGVDTLFHAVTLCPVSNVFKFWAAKAKPGGSDFQKLVDIYADAEIQLLAMPPNTNSAWIIEQFGVVPTKTPKVFDLWVLWKSNKFSRIQNVRFDLNSEPKDWPESTFAANASVTAFPSRGPDDIPSGSDDIADFWEEWILYPERFPDSVLETALRIYTQSFPPVRQQETAGPLSSRIATTLSASVQQPINIREESLATSHRQVLGTQWERFARLCAELDRQRHEAQTLAIDPYLKFVWVTYSDMLNLIRNCTEVEFLLENIEQFPVEEHLVAKSLQGMSYSGLKLSDQQALDMAWLVYCATKLMECFTEVYVDECKAALAEDITQDAMFATLDRVQTLYGRMEIEEHVPEEVLGGLLDAIGRIEDVYGAFERVIDYFLFKTQHPRQTELTPFGEKILVSGAQEVILTCSQTLINVLYLLILLVSLNARENPKRAPLKASELIVLFERYFKIAKEYELLSWMSRKKLPDGDAEGTEEEALAQELEELAVSGSSIPAEKKSGPILQLLFLDSVGPALDHVSSGISLTAFIAEFLTEVHSRDYSDQAVQIATLLMNSRAHDLALDFLRFIPNTHWGTYAKGRIYLANGREELAAMNFKRCAYGLGKAKDNNDGNGLIAASARVNNGHGGVDTLLRNDAKLLNSGLALFYAHITRLFNTRKSYGYVLEFATLALGAFGTEPEPAAATAESERRLYIKDDILMAGFNAAVEVSSFDEAYQILQQINKTDELKECLSSLVVAMCSEGQSAKLCGFPFIGFQDTFEEVVEEKCQSQLDIRSGPPYHQILYSWRIERGDFKGAATVLHERLLRVQNAEAGIRDPTARNITDSQLALLNVLHCVGPDDAWVFSTKRVDATENSEGVPVGGAKRTRLTNGVSPVKVRTVVTREEIYMEYQAELEKNRTLANGGFYLE